MMNYQITTAVIGLLIASTILYLVRRDHLHGPYAYWWLLVAGATVVLGARPSIIDYVARLLGIAYAPTLLFAVVIGMMLIKMLQGDIERSRHERKIRRLAQHLAILDEENQRLRQELQAHEDDRSPPRTATR